MSEFYKDSIFWVEVDRVKPNPYQPRREFDEVKLNDLAESIRQYGVLQPVVVTRHEIQKEDGGLSVEYELIVGERRLRAARIAGLSQIPSIIRTSEESGRMKLELAIIENLQREDLNPIDRARAFNRLVKEFSFKHGQIAQKIGKSREYVANSVRLLAMPEEMQEALSEGKITEGHTRPILMLNDRPEERDVLFKEILSRKLTVREAESIARRIATDKVRKKSVLNPEILELERQLTELLGTRVQIEQKEVGGKVVIDYFSKDDLNNILLVVKQHNQKGKETFSEVLPEAKSNQSTKASLQTGMLSDEGASQLQSLRHKEETDGRAEEEPDDDIYSVKNFTI